MKKVLSVILGLALLAGCSRQNYQAEKDFWHAEQLLAGIKKTAVNEQGPQVFDPVIDAFKKIYEKYPSSPKAAESLFVVGNLYLRQKKFEEAIQTLEKVVQNYPDKAESASEARYGIAGIYEVTGRWEKAEPLFWETAEYHPFNQKGLYAPVHIILHYKKTKDQAGMDAAYQKAAEYYQKTLKKTGPIQAASAIQNYLALAQMAYGNWKEARTTWDALPAAFPKSPYAPLALLASGELSWKKQDFDAAIASYENYLKNYPEHNLVKRTTVQMGMLYAAKKEYVKARDWFESAIENEKNPDTLADTKLLIGRTFQEEGNWGEAEKIYQEVESKFNNTNAALQVPFLIAAHHEEKGNQEESKKILDTAIERYQSLVQSSDPRMSDYALRLQNAAYAEKGDWEKVLSNFDRKLQQETSPVRKGNWVFLKAIVLDRRVQDSQAALSLYQKFLADYPEHPLAGIAKVRLENILKKA